MASRCTVQRSSGLCRFRVVSNVIHTLTYEVGRDCTPTVNDPYNLGARVIHDVCGDATWLHTFDLTIDDCVYAVSASATILEDDTGDETSNEAWVNTPVTYKCVPK